MYSNGFSKKWFWKFFMMWFFWKKFSNREFSKIPGQKYFLKSLKVLFLCVFYGNISQTLGTFFLPFHQLKIGVRKLSTCQSWINFTLGITGTWLLKIWRAKTKSIFWDFSVAIYLYGPSHNVFTIFDGL